MRKLHDWEAVQRCYNEGIDAARCREQFRITYNAWIMAIKRGKLSAERGRSTNLRRINWAAVQCRYDEGHSFYECMRRFGFSRGAWHKAVKRRQIRPRPLARPLNELLASGRSRTNIKRRLLRAGLLENRCQLCDLTEWLGQPIAIQIDHVNGLRHDHRLENLRMLCPNCHSQTETYGRRQKCRGSCLHESVAST